MRRAEHVPDPAATPGQLRAAKLRSGQVPGGRLAGRVQHWLREPVSGQHRQKRADLSIEVGQRRDPGAVAAELQIDHRRQIAGPRGAGHRHELRAWSAPGRQNVKK
jgi:hypothetical protein